MNIETDLIGANVKATCQVNLRHDRTHRDIVHQGTTGKIRMIYLNKYAQPHYVLQLDTGEIVDIEDDLDLFEVEKHG